MRTQVGLNRIAAQGAAFRIAQEYGFRHPTEIDLEALATDQGIRLRFGRLSGCEARLVRVGKRGIVRVRNGDPFQPRCRFAISHELGHWVLHPDSQSFICTADKLRDYRKDPKEFEANTFASELLMPTGLLRPFLARRELAIDTARAMAEHFNVSVTASAIRLCIEKKDESYLVLSKNQKVEWASRFCDRSGIWIERGQPLNEQSNAWHLCQHPEPEAVVETVDPLCWFPEFDNSDSSLEISEHSFSLEDSGYVLTILLITETGDVSLPPWRRWEVQPRPRIEKAVPAGNPPDDPTSPF